MRIESFLKKGVFVGTAALALLGTARRAEAASWHAVPGSPPAALQPLNVPYGGTSIISAEVPGAAGTVHIRYLTTTPMGASFKAETGTCTWSTTTSSFSCLWAEGTDYWDGVAWSATSDMTFTINEFGWKSSGDLYKNGTWINSGGGASDPLFLMGLTVESSGLTDWSTYDLALTAMGSPCSGTGEPSGYCIYKATSGTGNESWSAVAIGGLNQITQNADHSNSLDELWGVDDSGGLWLYTMTSTGGSWTSEPNSVCGGGSATFGQYALNDDSWALLHTGSGGGDVYIYNFINDCWQEPSGGSPLSTADWALSIAAPVAANYSDTNGDLWATDKSGDLWVYY